MFISNSELINVLKQATNDEKLSLTKILSESSEKPYRTYELQKKFVKWADTE